MQNLNQWREWLNNTSEQEWANFAAQHGDQLEAIQQAWAAFIAQPCQRQPENAITSETQMQPENTVDNEPQQQPENQHETAAARCQDGIQGQPENVAASARQTPVQTDFRLPETLTQPENEVTRNTQIQPENTADNETQRQSENANGAATARRQDGLQGQPENAVTNDTQRQPEKPTQPALPPQPAPTPTMPKHTPPRLPNARCGEPYRADFPLPPNATNITFEPECGLTWDAAAQQIHGTPSQSGDIEIRYEIEENGNPTVHRLQLYINPNPRDLWQTIDSDPNARFAKPDTAHDSIPTPQGSLIAARVRGRSHAHNGTHCDDDYRIAHHERTGLHFIAVADGAGSAEFSRYGSQLAVNAAADTVWQLLDNNEKYFRLPESESEAQKHALENLISNAAYQAYVAQKNAAETEQIDLKKLACTLLIALALPRTDGTWLIATYWVGDGAAAVWQPENQQLMLLGESDGGAYSGETVFLSANEVRPENLSKRIREWQGQQPPVLMLMTDGVSDPKFETDANLTKPERWAALWQELQPALQAEQPAAALEDWLGFWSAGNHDDRTLALFLPTKAA